MKRIIFDTDLGGDCDDVLALDLLLSAHRAGDCELLGVTSSMKSRNAPDCIRAILKEHGLAALPVGRLPMPEDYQPRPDCYAAAVAEAFSDPDAPGYAGSPDAPKLLRKLLAERGPVTLTVTGFMTNIAALLKSEPDDISPLNGMALVERSVEEIAFMGCNFTHQTGINPLPDSFAENGDLKAVPECNIVCDIPSAMYVFEHCPVPITVCPFDVGFGMITGKPMVDAGCGKNPDSLAFITHGSINGRDSWDPATALYGVYGVSPWFYRSAPGRVTVTGEGITHFDTNGGGRHRVLSCALPQTDIAREIDGRVMRLFERPQPSV